MGRQVNFFANQQDLDELFEFISSVGGITIDQHGKEISEKLFDILSSSKIACFFIKAKNVDVLFNKYHPDTVCPAASGILELDFSFFENEKDVICGRIYLSTGISSPDIPEIREIFNRIKKHITKNYVHEKTQSNQKTYLGKFAFEELCSGNRHIANALCDFTFSD